APRGRGAALWAALRSFTRRFELTPQRGQHLFEILLHLDPQQLAQQAADQRDIEFKIHHDRGSRSPALRRERPRPLVAFEIAFALTEPAEMLSIVPRVVLHPPNPPALDEPHPFG